MIQSIPSQNTTTSLLSESTKMFSIQSAYVPSCSNIGNEVVTVSDVFDPHAVILIRKSQAANETGTAPFLKAAARDIKAYL